MSTRRYLISKILGALLTLAFILAFNFFLFRLVGNPLDQLLKQIRGNLTPAQVKQLEAQLGLNLPLIQQFVQSVLSDGQPAVDGPAGRAVNRVLEAVYR